MFHGVINLDKPAGLTSARVVDRVKRLLPRGTKIGHAGSLDPFATGVLLLLIGKATKSCEQLMAEPKTYLTTIKPGATTLSGQPAYRRARAGETLNLKPRIVHVHAIDLLEYTWPFLKLRIDCGR